MRDSRIVQQITSEKKMIGRPRSVRNSPAWLVSSESCYPSRKILSPIL